MDYPKTREEKLYDYYLTLQSDEFKEDILNWESFKEPNTLVSLRINFTWGWLRVYYTNAGNVEWY